MGIADKDLKDNYKKPGYDFRDYIPKGAYRKRKADGGIMGGNKTYHQVRDQFMPMDSESMGYANGGGVGSMMQPKKKTLKAVNELQAKAPEGEFLAYINQGEANALKDAGGSGHLVNGIPSFVGSDYGSSGYQGGMRGSSGYQGSKGGDNISNNNNNNNGPDRSYVTAQQQANHVAAQAAAKEAMEKATRRKEILSKINPITGIYSLLNKNPLSMLGSMFGKGFKGLAGKMRGINPETGLPNTQAEYEQNRYDRQQIGRLDDLYAAKDKGYNSLFGMKTNDFTPGQQSKIDMLEQNYDPTTARNVDSGRGSGLRNTLAANNIINNNMKSELFDPNEIQSLINNAASKNTQPQGLSMMEQYYNDIDNRATGPNIVQDASTLAQQAKTFNTIDALNSLGNTTEKGFFGTGLTDQGKALEAFRNSAVNFKNAPANTANTPEAALGFMTDPARAGISKYDSIRENKDFIQNAINQGFLQTEDDYTNQKSLEDFI